MSTLAKALATLSDILPASAISDMARDITKQTYELGRFALVVRLADDSALFCQCLNGELVYTAADTFNEANKLVDELLDKLSPEALEELFDALVENRGVDAIIEVLINSKH